MTFFSDFAQNNGQTWSNEYISDRKNVSTVLIEAWTPRRLRYNTHWRKEMEKQKRKAVASINLRVTTWPLSINIRKSSRLTRGLLCDATHSVPNNAKRSERYSTNRWKLSAIRWNIHRPHPLIRATATAADNASKIRSRSWYRWF